MNRPQSQHSKVTAAELSRTPKKRDSRSPAPQDPLATTNRRRSSSFVSHILASSSARASISLQHKIGPSRLSLPASSPTTPTKKEQRKHKRSLLLSRSLHGSGADHAGSDFKNKIVDKIDKYQTELDSEKQSEEASQFVPGLSQRVAAGATFRLRVSKTADKKNQEVPSGAIGKSLLNRFKRIGGLSEVKMQANLLTGEAKEAVAIPEHLITREGKIKQTKLQTGSLAVTQNRST